MLHLIHYSLRLYFLGRIILTSPPLQQVPHKCCYLSAKRPSLHEELLAIPDDLTQRSNVIEEMNYNSLRSYSNNNTNNANGINYKGNTVQIPVEWVKVVKMNQIVGQPVQYSTGKLAKITNTSILDPMVSISDHFKDLNDINLVDEIYSKDSLVNIWRTAGHSYPTDDDKAGRQRDSNCVRMIRQVIVDFGARSQRSQFYVYPADKVFRLAAGIKPNEVELTLLKHSLREDGRTWLTTLLGEKTDTLLNSLRSLSVRSVEVEKELENDTVRLAVREGLRAGEGFVLLAADYCQIELRLLTHFCGDKDLCEAFQRGEDVFKAIAARWNNKTEDEVNSAISFP